MCHGLIFVFSLYFQTIRHYSPLLTGLAFAPSTVAVLAGGNLLAGRLAAATGTRRVLAGAAVLIAARLAGLLVIASTTAYPAIVVQLVILGFGLGLLVPAMTSTLLGSVDTSRSGIASGTLNTARQTGSVIGVALFGSLAASGVVTGLRLGLLFSVALALTALAMAAGIEKETASCPTTTPTTTTPTTSRSSIRTDPLPADLPDLDQLKAAVGHTAKDKRAPDQGSLPCAASAWRGGQPALGVV